MIVPVRTDMKMYELNQPKLIVTYPTFSTVECPWRSIASNLFVPVPTTFSCFFVGDPFHQTRIATAHHAEGKQNCSHHGKVNVCYPLRLVGIK